MLQNIKIKVNYAECCTLIGIFMSMQFGKDYNERLKMTTMLQVVQKLRNKTNDWMFQGKYPDQKRTISLTVPEATAIVLAFTERYAFQSAGVYEKAVFSSLICHCDQLLTNQISFYEQISQRRPDDENAGYDVQDE